MSKPSKAMTLRFPDPQQHDAIAAAARARNMSMQDYILSAAYERAAAVERTFLAHFDASVAHSHEAFAADPGASDPSPEQRAAELQARREFEEPGQGRAA